jgi:voltage-gated potassium channel
MASFVARPHVAEFVDVVMHERSLEFRMQEFDVPEGSLLAGQTLREADLRKRAGVLILALRRVDGTFTTNPDPDIVIEPHQILIAVGTDTDFDRLEKVAT